MCSSQFMLCLILFSIWQVTCSVPDGGSPSAWSQGKDDGDMGAEPTADPRWMGCEKSALVLLSRWASGAVFFPQHNLAYPE